MFSALWRHHVPCLSAGDQGNDHGGDHVHGLRGRRVPEGLWQARVRSVRPRRLLGYVRLSFNHSANTRYLRMALLNSFDLIIISLSMI